jgi:hypothetical protein
MFSQIYKMRRRGLRVRQRYTVEMFSSARNGKSAAASRQQHF